MPRFIPAQLLAHKRSGTTTLCQLLRIEPVTPGYAPYGVTTLDRDVLYDDGNGPMLYTSAVGAQPTAIQSRGDLAVDNAESQSLMPEFDVPVTETDLRAGIYDFARFALYEVNYEDLSQGHVTLHAGTIGQVTVRDDGLSFINELRGLAAQLKQSVCEKDSLTCRAIFGSQPAGSEIPGPIERFPCGFDATSLLVASTVEEVGLETTRTFKVPDFLLEAGDLVPGMLVWHTGANAGRTFEIESNTADGWLTLGYETPFPIAEGDELSYRKDCNKVARDDEKGCKAHWDAEWVLHFRGEPDIPIGDAGVLETPGASRRGFGDVISEIVERENE